LFNSWLFVDRFYVQNRKEEDRITNLLESLQAAAAQGEALSSGDVFVGLACLSLFSDGSWYRARVTQLISKVGMSLFKPLWFSSLVGSDFVHHAEGQRS